MLMIIADTPEETKAEIMKYLLWKQKAIQRELSCSKVGIRQLAAQELLISQICRELSQTVIASAKPAASL